MLTDPISDYLTRVRNALAADHTDVEVPASRLKKELSRILTEQGYINSYEVEPTAVGGAPSLRHPRRRAASPRRHGHLDRLHLFRRDDRPPGEGQGRRRRGRCLHLVSHESHW